MSFLSGLLDYAAQIGVIKTSPCVKIKYLKRESRKRYITDDELLAFIKFVKPVNPMLAAYMNFRYITGRRDCEVLTLKYEHVRNEGIIFYLAKAVKGGARVPVLQRWNDDLRRVYEELVDSVWKPSDATLRKKGYVPPGKSAYVVCSRRGAKYTHSGVRTPFNRLMREAVRLGILEQRFTLHDIRSKTANDAKTVEVANEILAHSDIKTTLDNYWSKIDEINALERPNREQLP